MKIGLINPYFGKWPVWFPMFLLSCKHNTQIDWIIPTDCEIPPVDLPNVHFIKSSLNELCQEASKTLSETISYINPYKICDLRPAFGLIYQDLLTGYDFWGHCDLDVVWGDLSPLTNNELLSNYDIISSRDHRISGHFTLYRNTDILNNAFRKHPIWQKAMQENTSFYFDEVGMTEVFSKYWDESGQIKPRTYWPKFQFNWSEPRGRTPAQIPFWMNRWVWKQGKTYEVRTSGEHKEVPYFNFMSWKKTLKKCFVEYGDNPDTVYFSFSHFGTKRRAIPAQIGSIDLTKLLPNYFK